MVLGCFTMSWVIEFEKVFSIMTNPKIVSELLTIINFRVHSQRIAFPCNHGEKYVL